MKFGSTGSAVAVFALAAGAGVLGAVPAQAAGGADGAISAERVAGKVGDTVRVPIRFQNLGSEPLRGAEIVFVAPSGTVFTSGHNLGDACRLEDGNRRLVCSAPGDTPAGHDFRGEVAVRIESAAGIGSITLSANNDTNPLNNSASIIVTSGGLSSGSGGLSTGSAG